MNQPDSQENFQDNVMVTPDDEPARGSSNKPHQSINSDARPGEKIPGGEHESQQSKELEHP